MPRNERLAGKGTAASNAPDPAVVAALARRRRCQGSRPRVGSCWAARRCALLGFAFAFAFAACGDKAAPYLPLGDGTGRADVDGDAPERPGGGDTGGPGDASDGTDGRDAATDPEPDGEERDTSDAAGEAGVDAADTAADAETDAGGVARTCRPTEGGGSSSVTRPELAAEFADRWHAGWRGSAAVADIDGDGANELLAPREGLVIVYEWDGTQRLRLEVPGRLWASPVVVDLLPSRPGLEIVATVRERIYAWGADGALLDGFPVSVADELRSLAVGDLDGDADLEIVVASTSMAGGPIADVVYAYHHDGASVAGFPPQASSSSGCDDWCFPAGAFDQNLAVADLDGDGAGEIVLTQDNAYFAVFQGTGEVWPSAEVFAFPTRVLGVRLLHDYALSQQGYPNDEAVDLQAHGTNSPPAVVDVDGDGEPEVVFSASVQNAAQDRRELGVALWVLRPDGSRPSAFAEPLYVPGYLAGLSTFPEANLPEASQHVAVADLDPSAPGPEFVFPGLDGQLHAAASDGRLLWSHRLTSSDQVLVAGAAIADLSGDGRPEVVVTTYGPADGAHALTVLDRFGERLHALPLPDPGSMSVPTIADVNGDDQLEIVVNVSGGQDGVPQLLAFTVPGSAPNCLPWPTGRANLRRDGAAR